MSFCAKNWRARGERFGALALLMLLSACSVTANKQQPAALSANADLLKVRQVWSAQLGTVNFPLTVQVSGQTLALGSSDGTLSVLDADTGAQQWRFNAGAALAAGVGYDGSTVAAVTSDNDLVVVQAGRELWRQRLTAQSYTAPLVAGGRVFVLTADRAVSAFDAKSGRRLWNQQRPSEPLVLRQPGVLRAQGDTLVVGWSGKLVGLNPLNSSLRWEFPIASPRGTNDVERLVDLVGPVNRQGSVLCARAFQAAVGCADVERGGLLWTKPASGAVGLSGDDQLLIGVEADGTVRAWQRRDGEHAWSVEQLRYRGLTAPLVVGRAVALGDRTGLLHFLSRTDGAALSRVATDNTPIVATPVLAGSTVVVVTQGGRVFGYRPE